MTTILLYARRNTGMAALSYLVAKGFRVKLVTDDEDILKLGIDLRCEIVTMETAGEWDFMFSVHWNKIIPDKYLKPNKCVNFHPLLHKYLGASPVKRYIENADTKASIGSHIMTNEVDNGTRVDIIYFETGIVDNYAEFYNIALPHYYTSFRRTLEKLNIRP